MQVAAFAALFVGGSLLVHRFVPVARRAALAGVLSLAVLATTVQSVAAADAPNTCAAATTASPLNTWITESIATSGDFDWYRFNTATSGYGLITLAHPPKDYRLDLYNSSCRLVAASNRIKLQYEEIYRSLPAGTYYVRVAPMSSTAYSPTAYALRLRTLANGAQVLSSAPAWTDTIGYLHIPGEVLNNTAERREYVKITATYYNSANQIIATDFAYTTLWTLNPRTRSPFELMTELPAGYHHHKLSVTSSITSTAPVGNLAVAGGVPYTDSIGYRHYVGSVTNNNSFSVQFVQVALTLYNAKGYVIATDYAFTDPYDLAAGQTAPFDVFTDRFNGTNRHVFAAEAQS